MHFILSTADKIKILNVLIMLQEIQLQYVVQHVQTEAITTEW